MNLELLEKRPLTRDIISFYFHKPSSVRYNAGEYIEISLDFERADERGNRHWFTLSSSPTEKYLTITTRFPARMSTFKQHLRKLSLGQKVQISPPMGDFILPPEKSLPLVFVAGGIGITPFRSMCKYIVDTKEHRQVQLIYSARTAKDFVFIDLFEKTPGLTLIQNVSEPGSGWKGESGALDLKKIDQLAKGLHGKMVYFSGPEPMVENFKAQIDKTDHPKHLVKTDFFPGYSDI